MTMKPIAGLLYEGHQCSYDDGATTPPVEPPVGPPVETRNSVIYNSVAANSVDNYWLGKKLVDYRTQLRSLPGSQQLYFDILVDGRGRRYSDAQPAPPGYVKDPTMKNYISNLINTASFYGQKYDPATYTGRLIPIYDELVKDKLAGDVKSEMHEGPNYDLGD
jgi:hypothetical protein